MTSQILSDGSALRLLFLSTPVAPLGTGLGGGVELTLYNLAIEMTQRGHRVQIVAPEGSQLPQSADAAPVAIAQIPGKLQTSAQTQHYTDPITLPPESVLGNMWDYARQVQHDVDVLVNFAYDWLPLYLTPFFQRPVAHLISMGSLSAAMDAAIQQVARMFPGTLAAHSHAQVDTFPDAGGFRVLGNGLDLSRYEFCAEPENRLGWVGRLAPEKGLEDAIALAAQTQIPLSVWGAMPDPAYWQQIQQRYPDAPVEYRGFLSTEELQQDLGRCRALVMTPKWVEAFGNVAVEALACGVPVIAYRRGGPSEIVIDGETGWLVEPDQVAELVAAVDKLGQIDRAACRRRAEAHYSMQAMGDRTEQWFRDLLQKRSPSAIAQTFG
ncbi:glycosyltransferase family 4 protein [Thermoleptolyngbya sp. M55_K2018_002]|uniref:glycosyltransferase family 4 protein n=1 Tax=Thermoleptolyngbya sp. M55_K2018_002 TaxID=2747808 RepID=UPI0019E4D2A2|nr:glycosyltransferase family 4 protein [Thermoleptolyngbya sp. M55_K2018_002]HIK41357.1 glycosyltransferase family 4 protein [Thermoleptolyngbya sp. M55_K2018_002]